MTHDDVLALMEAIRAATGCPYAYDHFAEGESPDPPFLCFLYPQAAEFGADNIVYHSFSHLDIEAVSYTHLIIPACYLRAPTVIYTQSKGKYHRESEEYEMTGYEEKVYELSLIHI